MKYCVYTARLNGWLQSSFSLFQIWVLDHLPVAAQLCFIYLRPAIYFNSHRPAE